MSYYNQQEVYYDNAALMVDPYYPGLHVQNLAKIIGQAITASWAIRNNSLSVTGFARLQLDLQAHQAVLGNHVTIPTNTAITMPGISLIVTTGSGLVSGSISMLETTSAGVFIRTLSQHSFTVLIGGGGGAVLEVVGDPTII